MRTNETNTSKTNVLGLILAGGNSLRLGGGDKTLRPLGDHTILHHVCKRLKAQVAEIVISSNSDPDFFASFPYAIIDDGKWRNSGPLGGILAGCNYAKQFGYSHIMSIAADTPFFPANLLDGLLQAQIHAQANPEPKIIFARSGTNIHPTFALWPTNIAEQLENWLQETQRRSIRVFAGNHSVGYADFNIFDNESGLEPFFNINTQEELMQARQAWQLHKSEDEA